MKGGIREIQIVTYVPSGRLDSGMTRSRVWGSRAMPAAVCSGLMGGRDMMNR